MAWTIFSVTVYAVEATRPIRDGFRGDGDKRFRTLVIVSPKTLQERQQNLRSGEPCGRLQAATALLARSRSVQLGAIDSEMTRLDPPWLATFEELFKVLEQVGG